MSSGRSGCAPCGCGGVSSDDLARSSSRRLSAHRSKIRAASARRDRWMAATRRPRNPFLNLERGGERESGGRGRVLFWRILTKGLKF